MKYVIDLLVDDAIRLQDVMEPLWDDKKYYYYHKENKKWKAISKAISILNEAESNL